MSDTPARVGRPREPVPVQRAARLIEHLSEGRTLADWCRAEGVGARTVYDWLAKDDQFAADYARAREAGGHLIADDLLRIADSATDEDVQSARLQVDVRKWLLARWLPRSYGERQQVEHGGQGVQVVVTTGVPRDSGEAVIDYGPAKTTPTPGGPSLAASRAGGEEHNISDTHISPDSKPRVTVEIDPPSPDDPL